MSVDYHTQFQTVRFDPTNPEHVAAYEMLVYQKKQHPTLRFVKEPTFNNLTTQLQHYVGLEFIRQHQHQTAQ